MNNLKRGFSTPDFLLLVLVASLIAGGFYFVFRTPGSPPAARSPAAADRTSPLAPESRPATDKTDSAVKLPSGNVKPADVGAASPAAAPAPAPLAAEDDGEGAYGIEGTVFSLGGGQPLAHCEVRFMEMKTVTQADGAFRLTADGGVGILRFSCPGFRPEAIFRFDITAGSGMANFDVYLSGRRDAARGRIEINGISGRVYDQATGAPLLRAWVTVGPKRTRTDRAGFFELWGLDTGLASLKVAAPGHIGEMISGIELNNLANPLYYEVSLEPDDGGKFHFALVGIGARLMPNPKGRGCRIAAVLDDSPAARAGLEAGDILLAVDGVAVDDASTAEIVELIRGRAGQPVELLVERQGEVLSFTCVRERVLY